MRARARTAPKTPSLAAQSAQMALDLGAIRKALRRPLEAEVAKGALTPPQTAVMRVVVQEPGVSLKDLSRAVSLAHSTVSGIADRLEKRGMIERRSDEADGRVAHIFPTARVTEFVRKRMPSLEHAPLKAALQRASAAERATIARALQRLRALLEDG